MYFKKSALKKVSPLLSILGLVQEFICEVGGGGGKDEQGQETAWKSLAKDTLGGPRLGLLENSLSSCPTSAEHRRGSGASKL